jgi:hypothetical protein
LRRFGAQVDAFTREGDAIYVERRITVVLERAA